MLCLVVDDEPLIRNFVQSILHLDKFETIEARNGFEALEIVRTVGGGVDLIVTDIQMPGGDGLSLARAVRKLFPAVQIILMSGYPNPDSGFEYIAKPFSWADMRAAVRGLLARNSKVA